MLFRSVAPKLVLFAHELSKSTDVLADSGMIRRCGCSGNCANANVGTKMDRTGYEGILGQ